MILFGDWYGEAGAKESGAHAIQLLQTKPEKTLLLSIQREREGMLLSHVSSSSFTHEEETEMIACAAAAWE
jgi:hypothetical protein